PVPGLLVDLAGDALEDGLLGLEADAAAGQVPAPSRRQHGLHHQESAVPHDHPVAADAPPNLGIGGALVLVTVDVEVASHESGWSSARMASRRAISAGVRSSCSAIRVKPSKGRSGCRRAYSRACRNASNRSTSLTSR